MDLSGSAVGLVAEARCVENSWDTLNYLSKHQERGSLELNMMDMAAVLIRRE